MCAYREPCPRLRVSRLPWTRAERVMDGECREGLWKFRESVLRTDACLMPVEVPTVRFANRKACISGVARM